MGLSDSTPQRQAATIPEIKLSHYVYVLLISVSWCSMIPYTGAEQSIPLRFPSVNRNFIALFTVKANAVVDMEKSNALTSGSPVANSKSRPDYSLFITFFNFS
jgi:hypothetical protein